MLVSLSKDKFHPITGHEALKGESRYCSTLFLTSALDEVGCQRYVPAALPPGKTGYPLYRRLGGPQVQSGQVRKISSPLRLDLRTFQPLASRYTVSAIRLVRIQIFHCSSQVLQLSEFFFLFLETSACLLYFAEHFPSHICDLTVDLM